MKRKNRTSLFHVLAGILIGATFSSPLVAQSVITRELSVSDSRPVAKAIEGLMSAYPDVLITYEDPKFGYSGDLVDVTQSVRRDLPEITPDRVQNVLVPSSGSLRLVYTETNGRLDDAGSLMESIVYQQNQRTAGGRFQVRRTGEWLHVVPTSVRNAAGFWTNQSSVLDGNVSVFAEGLTAMAVIQEIVTQLSRASGEKILIGSSPVNLLLKSKVDVALGPVAARDALMDTLDATGAKVAWQLFYDVNVESYVLNLRAMSLPTPQAREQRERSAGTGPPAFGVRPPRD